ncbi:DNA methyltransferase [uncultured Methanobrevibacter sp.]|uniref:DNA methyltransferase n=1 Tax=uncultured Methanobrevibacter sp. TaxID=253161 RepID=UPI0025CDECDD|nr:DNA methyltransferase [uncultured Methanobrevibacter sp.]
MLNDAIENYGVYSNQQLKDFIYNLENKYNVTDEVEFFNQLVNFSKNKDVPYHGWFKYREGFSYTLIKELLKRCGLKENEYVLDPFCGCGTTVVEAKLNGLSAIGIDINPVSAFISEVKCQSYNDEEISLIKTFESKIIEQIKITKIDEEYIEKYKEVKKFFNEDNFEKLILIRQVLDSNKKKLKPKIYEFFLCAYVCIIEEVSDRKRDGNGLKTSKSKINNVTDYYLEKLNEMVSDIESNRISKNLVSIVERGDAMKLSETVNKYTPKIDKTIGAIMYSPPYANSFDYFESYKMEVILADYATNMKRIKKYRQQAIESFIGRPDIRVDNRKFIDWMALEIEKAIPEKEARTGRKDSRTRKVPKMIKGYFADMEKVISESSDVLPSGKKCYIVVDQSAYLGKIVPTDLFLAAIAEYYGFKVNEIIMCRIAKTSGQQIQLYPYLRDSLRESIVVLEKI